MTLQMDRLCWCPKDCAYLQGFHRVQGFAGLGDGDDQLFRIGNHVAVAVFAGDFDVGRDFGDGFEPVFGGQRGVGTPQARILML